MAGIDFFEGTRYLHADHLGSTRAITDSSGINEVLFHFYPFGEHALRLGVTTEAMQFTGHERDEHIAEAAFGTDDDLDYMHARYYNPMLGRFLSFDPVNGSPLNPSSWNAYSYVRGCPLASIDPDGTDPKDVVLGRYKFHLDLRNHGGPHVDIFERRGGNWRNLGRVRIPELTPIKFKGKVPRIPNKALKLLRGFVRGAGLIGGVMTVLDAEAANEDHGFVLIVQDELNKLASERGLDLASLSEEEFIELLDELLMPESEATDPASEPLESECGPAGSFNASEDSDLCQ